MPPGRQQYLPLNNNRVLPHNNLRARSTLTSTCLTMAILVVVWAWAGRWNTTPSRLQDKS